MQLGGGELLCEETHAGLLALLFPLHLAYRDKTRQTQEAIVDQTAAQLPPAFKKHEILEQWRPQERMHLQTCHVRPDLLEVRTTRGTVLGSYVRVPKIGWVETL